MTIPYKKFQEINKQMTKKRLIEAIHLKSPTKKYPKSTKKPKLIIDYYKLYKKEEGT